MQIVSASRIWPTGCTLTDTPAMEGSSRFYTVFKKINVFCPVYIALPNVLNLLKRHC